MKKSLLFIFCFLGISGLTWAQTGKLSGTIFDEETSEPVPFANVIASQNGVQKGGTTTDFNGNYLISSLVPGQYDVEVSYVGYRPKRIAGVLINFERTRRLDIEIASGATTLEEVVVEYQRPLIEADNTSTGAVLTKEQIQQLPTRSINAIITTAPAVFSSDDGGALNIKGNRSGSNQTFINGVKVVGPVPNLPIEAIEEISVITGGVPAQFGDATGGIINITTRSASSEFFGTVTAETSRPFDSWNQDLVGITAGGPLLTRPDVNDPTRKRTILGFFGSVQYQGFRDPDPPATPIFVVKDEVLDQIREQPMFRDGQSILYATDTLKDDQFDELDYRPNTERQDLLTNFTLDFQPSNDLLFTAGGNFNLINGRSDIFGSTGSNNLHRASAFNSENNTEDLNRRWNAFVRFTQNFRPSGDTASLVEDAYYQVQLDYGQRNDVLRDVRHGDDYLNYRYVGQFFQETGDFNIGPIATLPFGDGGLELQEEGGGRNVVIRNLAPVGVDFRPSELNPLLASYTQTAIELSEAQSIFDIVANRGLLNGNGPSTTYGLYDSPGSTTNRYNLSFDEQYRVSALGAATIGRHTIKVGFEYEQRVDAFYTIIPGQLWNIGRFSLNGHVDPFGAFDVDSLSSPDSIFVTPRATLSSINDSTGRYQGQSVFDARLRRSLGVSDDAIISIDELTPEQLSVDFFQAEDLLDFRMVGYRGYDYLGNRLDGSVAFEDFFYDAENRPQDAFRPIYAAGFIQDKFEFDDIIVNVGLRVDRFDANQKVLRDPNSLTRLLTVGDLRNSNVDFSAFRNTEYTLPGTIDDDFVVYVDQESNDYIPGQNEGDFRILGFRSGEVYYDAQGQEIQNARGVIDVGDNGQANPLFTLNGLSPRDREIWEESRVTLDAFEDYRPQINVQPRIAFSFPISDLALFFAHYDVRTQRPPARIGASPSDYYYLNQQVGAVISNANLRNERLVDYQVGFQGVLSPTSSIRFSAFYSELRDQIQIINQPFAYPTPYRTFGNIDFQTSKGLTVAYDLRRTENLRIDASYTLQFAEGTGSSDTQAANLTEVGDPNLRVPIPLNFDQRHALKLNLDYRFADDEGPLLFGKSVFENAGINFFIFAGSGIPFTRNGGNVNSSIIAGVQQRTQIDGSPNSSRLPWNIRSQLRVDKTFDFGNAAGERRPKALNVFVYIQNLFDRRNVLGVYSFTGSATDDGYLNSGIGREFVSQQANPEAFEQLYRKRLERPDFFSLPRRIRLGAAFNF
ncbi:MAG: carboxypeptidase regulatory-like domain-containing protein [Catalinimonas sp.]